MLQSMEIQSYDQF